jgi:putative peptidoglycan binding protein
MKTLFPPLLGCLLVVLVLFALISKDQTSSSRSGLTIVGEGISDFGEGLTQALLLRHQHQSGSASANTQIVKAQRLLQNYGYYSGPVDGAMNQRTREALRSFQESRQLTITGMIDSETARELGLTNKTAKS